MSSTMTVAVSESATSPPSSSATAKSDAILDVFKARRSIYALSNQSTIPDSRIQEIIQDVVYNAPSPFNVQSCRILVLLKREHEKLWDMATAAFKASVAAHSFESLKGKLKGLRDAYGTVLFFEDPLSFKECEARMGSRWGLVKDKCPQWSEHSNAMQQFAVWTTFAAEGLGCNLQHYNPLIDAGVQKTWNIPEEWSLKAQLVFGKPTGGPNEKTSKSIEDRVMMHVS